MRFRWPFVLIAVFLLSVLLAVCFAQGDKPWEKQGTKAGDEIVGPDGGKMVWVPAGQFMMGTTDNMAPPEAELLGLKGDTASPVHLVRHTRGFWLARCTVTNRQYRRYCQETGAAFPEASKGGDEDPVVGPTWDEAVAYCRHYGLRLPTEAQWEFAARGPEGRKYPWGNDWDPTRCANAANDQAASPYPVGSFPKGASWCGALDMAANVSQWCQDWDAEDYYKSSPTDDPQGPASGTARILRGSGWAARPVECRSEYRMAAMPGDRANGFRCAVTPGAAVGAAPSAATPGAKPWEHPGSKAGDEIAGPDGGKMVWVPAGQFMMGTAKSFPDEEQPVHKVRITRGFWLGKCTVTNAQYRQYCRDSGAAFPKDSDQGDDYPVIRVSWDDAALYCAHYGLGLPTEAQWEYAARGPESLKYPWGNEWDPKKCCHEYNPGPGGKTSPVGSFPAGASWCGALDMAGNVAQWCQDRYDEKYYANSPDTDPPGPDTGDYRVQRGQWFLGGRSVLGRGGIGCLHTNGFSECGFRCIRMP